MRRIATSIAVLLLLGSIANAQSGNPSGRGATTGDPAASSANPNAVPSTTNGNAMNKQSHSGSGTYSNMNVKPLREQNKPLN
jgi:hypothetical protein